MREHAPTAPTATADARMRQPVGAMAGVAAGDGDGAGEVSIDLPVRRSIPKVGRNEPCPCGSGKKYKNCCGRTAKIAGRGRTNPSFRVNRRMERVGKARCTGMLQG